jgi:hypothetical protein
MSDDMRDIPRCWWVPCLGDYVYEGDSPPIPLKDLYALPPDAVEMAPLPRFGSSDD